MSIKVYRIKIEGYVVHQDFGGPLSSQVTPADWDFDQLIVSMSGNCTVSETLVDTIKDEEKS
jgi:hypothetical protein